MNKQMKLSDKLRRSGRDVHTHHFNRGVLEHDPLEFEDMDDVVQTLWHRAEEAAVLLDEAERVMEELANDLEAEVKQRWGDDERLASRLACDLSPVVEARAFLAKLRKEQDDV